MTWNEVKEVEEAVRLTSSYIQGKNYYVSIYVLKYFRKHLNILFVPPHKRLMYTPKNLRKYMHRLYKIRMSILISILGATMVDVSCYANVMAT